MARYLSESDVYNLLGERGMATVHCSQIDVLPRADVAPRAEVAREIFEEIERFLKNQEAISENKRLKEVGDWIFHDYLPAQLTELKSKYTEANHETRMD